MKIKNFMSTDVFCLDPDNTIWEVASLFLEYKIDGAPVVKEGKLLGLFTKTHLIRSIKNKTDMSTPVAELMSTEVVSVNPEEDIRNIDIMYYGRYPVVKDGKLLGFITKSDIMKALNLIIEEISGQMETVINSAYNPIVTIDREGFIRIWNNAAEKMTGLKKSEVIGKFINDVIPESELLKIVESGESEYGIRLSINSVSMITNRAPIIKNDEIIGAVAVLYDVSELEKISRELAYVKTLNAEMDAIIDSSFDGLYITDGQGKTIRINKAIKRITDLGEEELLHKTMKELVDTGILSRSASLMVIANKQSVTTTLTTITGKTLLVSATPLFDENDNVFRVVTNVRDITQLNMLKQKLEQMEGLKNHYEYQVNQMRLKLSGQLIFENKEMEKIVYQAIKVGEVDSNILITGESGVGKELIAEIIHNNSSRKNGPFIKLNCTAIPESLLESELFGYDAGAFTGARKEGKPGLFEVADEGTLLLDEIGDIPMHLQVKLLRAIQAKEIMRVGSTKTTFTDVRIIAITNRNLEEMISKGEFREDLYYRINVVPIRVPALRERKQDIPLLSRHFLDRFNQRYNLDKKLAPELIDALMKHNWPGNIRQLENLIERLIVTSSSEIIKLNHLPDEFLSKSKIITEEGSESIIVNELVPLKIAVESVEKSLLRMAFADGKSSHEVAKILKVDSSTISRKANKYGILNN